MAGVSSAESVSAEMSTAEVVFGATSLAFAITASEIVQDTDDLRIDSDKNLPVKCLKTITKITSKQQLFKKNM